MLQTQPKNILSLFVKVSVSLGRNLICLVNSCALANMHGFTFRRPRSLTILLHVAFLIVSLLLARRAAACSVRQWQTIVTLGIVVGRTFQLRWPGPVRPELDMTWSGLMPAASSDHGFFILSIPCHVFPSLTVASSETSKVLHALLTTRRSPRAFWAPNFPSGPKPTLVFTHRLLTSGQCA